MAAAAAGTMTGPLAAREPAEGSAPGDGNTDANTDAPASVFGDLDAFVREYLVHVVERRIAVGASSGVFWCSQWWAHPEAISRMYALWRAWETLRVADPATGMSTWWRDHLDPHLNALTAEDGPYARCQPGRHTAPQPLPVEACPRTILAQLPDA